MDEIITNEKAWVEDKIETLTLGKKPFETIGRLARYYSAIGYTKKDIPGLLEDFILRCEPATNIFRWRNAIAIQAKHADKYPLISVAGVQVTKGELAAIRKLEGKQRQKLMFTILCLAKYGNAVNADNSNWVNYPSRQIFSLANAVMTSERQALMINDLWRAGYIQYSRLVDNVNFSVTIVEEAGEPVLTITDFRNLGNQYLRHTGERCIECQCCGAVVLRASNAQKYCRKCAADVNRAAAAATRRS